MNLLSIRSTGSALISACHFALCLLLAGCAVGPGNVQVELMAYAVPPAVGTTRGLVQVDPVREARQGAVGRLIGQRTGLGGMSMGQVEVNPSPVSITTSVLQAELQNQGFTIVDTGAPVQLSARLTRFEIQTPATALYWDINGSVELEVEAKRSGSQQQTATYQARCTERTYAWPGETLIAKVLDSCLKELGTRIRADAALAGFLARR